MVGVRRAQLVYTVGALVWTMAFMLPAELRYEIFPFRRRTDDFTALLHHLFGKIVRCGPEVAYVVITWLLPVSQER